MPSTHLSLHYHLVFSTKNREPSMPAELRGRIHEYLGGAIRGMNGVAHAIGGISDHVHVFAGVRAMHCLADVMREIEASASRWMHTEAGMPAFAWQEGYGAFTVGPTQRDAVRQYIAGQEEHHRTRTFHEEYVDFLRRSGIEYDERYLW